MPYQHISNGVRDQIEHFNSKTQRTRTPFVFVMLRHDPSSASCHLRLSGVPRLRAPVLTGDPRVLRV